MAGAASSWFKVEKGPLQGQALFVPKAAQGTLSAQEVEAQLEAGLGDLFQGLKTGTFNPAAQVRPPFKKGMQPNIVKVPVVITQADGDKAAKVAQMIGIAPLWWTQRLGCF